MDKVRGMRGGVGLVVLGRCICRIIIFIGTRRIEINQGYMFNVKSGPEQVSVQVPDETSSACSIQPGSANYFYPDHRLINLIFRLDCVLHFI